MTPSTLGVVGAGTMGAGIAQLGCAAGIRTLLHDPVPEALARGVESVRRRADAGLLEPVAELDALAPCELVIEAAPERADLKRELFARLSEVCGEEAVLATNTSSIPVTSLAGAAARPEQVVGMHFFNPAPVMRLLEVIAADQTSAHALATARATGQAMGKHVIVAADGPGFLVNRCGRPFYTEALRLLQERVATHDQIDRICRLGGGFRMGPFELMDLVGIDVGLEVATSLTELSFGEPRWRPNPIQARMVAAGRLGRKTGRGYYDYSVDPYRPEDPERPQPGGGAGRVLLVDGTSRLEAVLRRRGEAAGFDTRTRADIRGNAEITVDVDSMYVHPDGAHRCGFHLLPTEDAALVELFRRPDLPADAARAAESFFTSLGYFTAWVQDAPGGVLGRIVCQLVNEAAFAIGEGVGSPQDIDAGLELGLNHPHGPVAWGEAIGLGNVLRTIDALYEDRHEERYRAAPFLRRSVGAGVSLGAVLP